MAHFAEIDETNTVLRVIVINNDVTQNLPFPESEPLGVEFCQSIFGGRWLQTSYNRSFRIHFAGIGSVYDSAKDAFIPQQPDPQCVLDESTLTWICPPDNETNYVYNPDTKSFDLAVMP
jgi:hypothetical protein